MMERRLIPGTVYGSTLARQAQTSFRVILVNEKQGGYVEDTVASLYAENLVELGQFQRK